MTIHPTLLLGLTGDPAQEGHVDISLYGHDIGYGRVWWMLTPHNPLKQQALASYAHRRELARLRIKGHEDYIEISDFEAGMTVLNEDIRTFTLLSHLKKVYPETPFTFLMGADNWASLHTWGRYQELLGLAAILILPREPWTQQLASCPASLEFADRQDTAETGIVPQGRWRIAHTHLKHEGSSTSVRQALRSGESHNGLTAEQHTYIRLHNLY